MFAGSGAGDRDRRQHRAIRQLDLLGAGPAGLLKVADEHHFLVLERRCAQDALRQLECRTVARRAGRRPSRRRSPGRAATRSLVARTFSSAFLENSTSVARSSPPRPSIGLPGCLSCLLPAIAVAHAGRLVEQHDDLARADRRRDRQRALRKERPRERRDQSAGSPRPAGPAGTSDECCGAAPTDRGCAAGTSARGIRRRACARAGSGGSAPGSRAPTGRAGTGVSGRALRRVTAPSSSSRASTST